MSAANVVRLFPNDNQPIINTRRKGRLPKNVLKIGARESGIKPQTSCHELARMFMGVETFASRAYRACFVGMYGREEIEGEEAFDVAQKILRSVRCSGIDTPEDLPWLLDEMSNKLAQLKQAMGKGGAA